MTRGGHHAGEGKDEVILPWQAPRPKKVERLEEPEPLFMSGEQLLFAARLLNILCHRDYNDDNNNFSDWGRHPHIDKVRTSAALEKLKLPTPEGGYYQSEDLGSNASRLVEVLESSENLRRQDRINIWDRIDYDIVDRFEDSIWQDENGEDLEDPRYVNPLLDLLKAIASGKLTIHDVRKQ